ncbi:MAG: tRNA (adenosine(37)-N6)-threonylcarbamoyltransferase complex ATPase subunit type 1 TsaE [Chloroflexota bacterium]
MSKPKRIRRRMETQGWLADGHPADNRQSINRDGELPCRTLPSASAEETRRVGELLGRHLLPSDVILLQGPLGAGKTCLTQGIARGYGFRGRVISPSFTLANVYELDDGKPPLYHLDLWRIKSPVEALGLGLDEYLAGTGPCVIEWPEVAETVMPGAYLRVRIESVEDGRRIEICAVGGRPRSLLEGFEADLAKAAETGGAVAARD